MIVIGSTKGANRDLPQINTLGRVILWKEGARQSVKVNSGTLSGHRIARLSLPLGNEMTYAIVVHGGAGFHANEDDPRVKAALNRLAIVGLASTAPGSILTTL